MLKASEAPARTDARTDAQPGARTEAQPDAQDNRIRCTHCHKTLAINGHIKCRNCSTLTPIDSQIDVHFYPGDAISGGSMFSAWQRHLAAAKDNGCPACGIKQGQEPSEVVRLDSLGNAWRVRQVQSSVIDCRDWAADECDAQCAAGSNTVCKECAARKSDAHPAAQSIKYATPSWLTDSLEPVRFEEMDPGDPYVAALEPVANPKGLFGVRVAFLVGPGTEEIELLYPMAHLRARGATASVITPGWVRDKYAKAYGKSAVPTANFQVPAHWVPIDLVIDEAKINRFEAVVIPGGAWSPITTRTDGAILKFVHDMFAAGKLVASICHGPQVLASAGLLRGKKVTGVADILGDLRAHGALLQGRPAGNGTMEPVVVDGNLITGEDPKAVVQFSRAIESFLTKNF